MASAPKEARPCASAMRASAAAARASDESRVASSSASRSAVVMASSWSYRAAWAVAPGFGSRCTGLPPALAPSLAYPGERLLQLAVGDEQMDGVGRKGPVVAGRLTLAQRLHQADLALREPQLDPRPDERIGLAALPLDARLAHEDADPLRLVEQQRIGARGEVAPIHGHLPARPDPVVALEAHPVAHDDVRFS